MNTRSLGCYRQAVFVLPGTGLKGISRSWGPGSGCCSDRLGPGPGCGDFSHRRPPAAHEPGGCVWHAVAQRFRFCFREVAVQGQPASSVRKAGRRFRGSCVTRPGSSLRA
jgi:hypothetical protein